MRVLSRAGLPTLPWRGRAALVFRRSAWFADDAGGLVGVFAPGLSASPRGVGLETDRLRVGPGVVLEFDGTTWALQGIGELNGVPEALEEPTAIPPAPQPSAAWADRWHRWLRGDLASSAEGRWLAGLTVDGEQDWEALVGRGSGSTPSGDDWVAGWFAGRTARGLSSRDDRDRLTRSLGRTTLLSRHYLGHLAEGRVEATLGAFLRRRPAPEPLSTEALVLAAHGDLSGRATLAGLVAGLVSGE